MMMETFRSWRPRPSSSDTAAGLGYPGDLRRDLGRPLGKQLVELLHADAGGLAEHPHGGPRPLFLVRVPHELDDLPVPLAQLVDALLAGDQRGHVRTPLRWVVEEPLLGDRDRGARVSDGWH